MLGHLLENPAQAWTEAKNKDLAPFSPALRWRWGRQCLFVMLKVRAPVNVPQLPTVRQKKMPVLKAFFFKKANTCQILLNSFSEPITILLQCPSFSVLTDDSYWLTVMLNPLCSPTINLLSQDVLFLHIVGLGLIQFPFKLSPVFLWILVYISVTGVLLLLVWFGLGSW